MFNSNQTLKTDLVNKVSGGESPEENIMQVYNFKGYDPLAEASITNDPYTEYAYIWDDSKGTLEVKTLHIGDNSAGYADVLNTKTFQALDPILIDIKDHIAPIQTIMSDLKQNESCKCFIAPAFMLKFRDDKIRNDKIEKAIYITLDAVTIFASGGTALALNTLHKVSTARRAWAAFEVAGALGNIAVNAKDVGPETVLGKFVTAYNNIALVVGAKNVRAGVSKFLKESSPELGISIASDKALQLSFDEFKNLEREYKALNSKPALWQNISPADQAKFAKSVSVIDRLFANVKSAIPEIKNYFTSKLLGVVEDNVTKALKISDDGTEIAQLSNSKLSITKESHFEMVDDLDINTQVDGQELKNLTSVEIDQVQYAVSEAKVKVVTKNGKKTIQCAGNGTYCFAQDTPLPDGTLMSEKQEGDFITAYDTEKKTTTQAKISKIRRSFTSAFTRLWIAGTMLSVTPAHALQTEAGEWVAAGQLKVGESLRSASGVVRLDSTFTESVSPTAVISYELEGGLDYLVGEMPVLVGGTCDLKTIKEALGTEFTIFQNRIISIGLNTTQRATLYKEFLAGNQQLRNLLKTEEGLKAWKGLANTTVRTNIAWLTRTKTWLSEGATLTHSSGRTVLQKAGVEIAEIKNGQLLPFNFSKYENRFPISGATPVGDVTDGYQVVRNGNNWGVRRVPDETPYSTVSHPDGVTTELSELKPNPDAHTLDRHGPDICDEALIERSRSGIAPDGSTIGMASAPPFSLPPSSSKFGSHADVKKALQNTRPGTPAFNATTPKPNGDKIVYHTLTDGTSYGKGVPRGSTSFIQSNMVRAVYKKVGTGPNDYQLVTMFPDF
jgi:hypothetical protein